MGAIWTRLTSPNFSICLRILFVFTALSGISKNLQAQCASLNPSFTTSTTSICGPGASVISFVNTSTGANAATADYDWYLNGVLFDNTSGLGAPSTSTISAVGTYTYMLVGTTTVGAPCDDTAFVTVTILPLPNASFTFTPNNACAGTNVAFTNTSTGTVAGTTYSWNFGDGSPVSTATNPSHAYAAGGTYNVTLTMTNAAGCTDVFMLPVTALDIPAVGISGDDGDGNTTYCLLPGDPTTSETVVFTNTTTGGVSYLWDFGDGTTSTAFSPSHTYTAFGTYTVTMTATGANGCTATATLTVVFEKYVAASLTLSILEYSGCVPHTLTTLTNLSVNANTYTWNFGDGTPAVTTTSPIPPAHTYTTGGTYTITLTASNSCNSATATISPIIIIDGPTAGFTPSTTLGCAPQNVSFVNTSTGTVPANNYQWDMGNGNTYTNVTTPPVQNYPAQGTYTVTLIAGNACGNDTVTVNIVIDSIPVADITSNPLIGCSPLTVSTVNNSYGNSITYQWFVDGVFTSTAANLPNQTFTAPPGNTAVTHTISLTVNNHCGSDTDAETITVHPAVVAQFNITSDTICEGGSVTFTDASFGDMLTYNWDFGEGTTSTLAGPHTITYNIPGTYVVTLDVNGFCGPSTVTQTITVLPYPVAAFTPLPDSGCAPLTVNFTNTSTVGATSYTWTFGAGSAPVTSALYNPPAVTYATAGTSTVTLTVNNLGCVSTATANITVSPLPVPAFTIVPNNGCQPLNVTFNNTSAVTAGDTYLWDFGNGTNSTLQNPPGIMYTNTGTVDSVYTVTLTITTVDGCSQTANQTVTVHPLPVADFTALPDTVCATTLVAFLNNSTGASTYSWNFGDGSPITTVISPAHGFATQGLYTVTLIATTAFGCTDTVQHDVFVDPIPNSSFNFTVECVGDSSQFTDLSTGAITNWAWNFGDGGTSALVNPAHLYAAAGTYSVSLTVTNTAGCTHTSTQLVTVNSVPVAGIAFTSTCLGTTTNYTDASTGTPVAWEWDFGDGSPVSNLQNPGHIYAATGTYTVQLISYGGSGCSDTATTTVTVTPIPTADFTFAAVCAGDTTFFTSTSLGAPDTFTWDFGDGTTDNTNNPVPSHVYNVAGTYTVTLTAGYAASGCTHSVTYTVDANPRTVPNFTNNTPCLGAPTNFTDLTTNTPITWEWYFGDGSPADFTQNPSHTYATPGIYTVSLITSNAFSCVDTFTTTIQVFALPVAGYTFDTICATFATTFTDASTSALLWSWDFGDGSPLANASSPTHVFPGAGTYTVQQVVTNAVGCTDTSTQAVTVNPNPVAAFNVTTACHTYANAFTDASTGAVTWEWDFGDGSALDFNQNPNHIYPLDGTYTAELEVTNIFGCSDSIMQTATVLLQPQSAFTNSTVCAKQPVSFTDNTTGSPTSWDWDFGDGGTSTLQNPTHTYLLGGTYTITLITGNPAGCMDTLTQTINVFTVPVPDFTADTVCLFNITHFTDLSTDAVAITGWFWDFGDGNNSLSSNPNYIYAAPGVYNVTLTVTNANGCDSTIVKQVVVNDIPVAAFTADTACVGSPTNFTDVSTGAPVTWLWDFGDGTTSTAGPTVSHTYATAGTYIVQLFVTGGTGACFDNTFGTVLVSNTVTAYFNDEDTACLNEVIAFTDSSTTTGPPITSWNWNFGDGNTSTLQNPAHAFTGPGNYLVTLSIAVGGGCNSSYTQNVLVVNDPSANFALADGCLNQTSTFNSTSSGNGLPIASTVWYFGDGNTATGTPAMHVYNAQGTYDVSLVVTGVSGCKDSVSAPVTIHPLPVAAFSNNSVCLGDTVFFNDLSTVASGSITNWTWDFGDGAGSALQEIYHVYTAQNDTFPVTLIVESNFGCLDTVTQDAVLHPIVTFDFGTDNANGCAPFALTFYDNSTANPSTIVGWVWYFDDGLYSFQQNPTHGFVNEGQYYVSLTVTTSDGCVFGDTLDYPVTVYPQPVAGFNANPVSVSIYQPEIQFFDLSTDAVFYEWDFGDLTHSNLANPEHYYTTTDTFNVMQIVTNNYGCSDTAIHPIVIIEEPAFYAPNAVTPDGDGLNEVFQPMAYGLTDYHLYIFNRWGELLFETTDITQPWDCTYKGQVVKQDVYVWKVKLHTIRGDAREHTGHVTVLK
ncbi:MAG TPA: PKD domain-containing protein [Flavobacteriales bacterium]|nr:PKD domain-containing protein [Flavobacteriales bacterium]